MDENFIKEQSFQLWKIERDSYKRGFEDGKKARDKELEDKRAKEMDEMARDSLRQEELSQERDEDIRADYHPRPEEVK